VVVGSNPAAPTRNHAQNRPSGRFLFGPGTNGVAFFTGDLEGWPPQDHPRPIAVLEVIP
jgi:hypothetical protein